MTNREWLISLLTDKNNKALKYLWCPYSENPECMADAVGWKEDNKACKECINKWLESEKKRRVFRWGI